MVSKIWLRLSILSVFLLAGCVQPTPTPAGSQTPAGGQTPSGYPIDSSTPKSDAYPAAGATPTAPAVDATQPGSPAPAPTTGAAARLAPL